MVGKLTGRVRPSLKHPKCFLLSSPSGRAKRKIGEATRNDIGTLYVRCAVLD